MKFLSTALLFTLTIPVFAADWPRWRGPGNDGHAPAGVVPKTLPNEPKVVWRVPIGEGQASPVVAAGKIFYLDNQGQKETVHAANATTGAELWKVTLDDVMHDSHSKDGPRCAPLVDGDRVYVQSCRGELQCLAVADGKLIWRANYVKDFGAVFTGEKGTAAGASRHGNTGSPLIDGDRLLVAAGGLDGAGVVCLDKLTGKPMWKSGSDPAGYGGPAVATVAGRKQVLVFTAKAVTGTDLATGAALWRFPVETSYGRHVTTPIAIGDIVVVSSHQVGLMGIKISEKEGAFQAERAWISKEFAVNFASPVLAGDHIYCVSPGKTLFCLNAQTGEKAWAKEGFFGATMRKEYGGFLVLKENLFTLTDTGVGFLVALDSKTFRSIGQTQICGETWCNPAYSDGKLYLRDNKELMCVQLVG